jgi:hypothetical protein
VIALVAAIAVQVEQFRYARPLQARGTRPAELVADGPMFAHARANFADVRIADANGDQVPWRTPPQPPTAVERRLPVLDAGRRGDTAVARVDLGPAHVVIDRVRLEIPDARFHGSVTVLGSDDRTTWTRLSTTEIYSVRGARPARSTTALLPPSDFRYLELRATHVMRIDGATVARTRQAPKLRRIAVRVTVKPTAVVVDLGYAKTPVDELRISAATRRYARPFQVSLPGGYVVAAGELVRTGAPRATVVPLGARTRFLEIAIDNGDNPALRGIRVEALARPRALLVEGGHRGPLTVYYGARVASPEYDFARLPRSALGRSQPAVLGPERRNDAFRLVDTRSFVARHRSLVTAALALAGVAVIGAAALTLRR